MLDCRSKYVSTSADTFNMADNDSAIVKMPGDTDVHRPKDVRVRYTILETPPVIETMFLGFQVGQ